MATSLGGGDTLASRNVATSSAVRLDGPAPVPPSLRAPDKPLVDELMSERRQRYRNARLSEGSHHCQVFPPLQSQRPRSNGKEGGRHSSTAPAQVSLLEGVQVGEEESNEKQQGQSTAHLLLRVLALSYVVPLCDTSDDGLPDNLTRQGYSAQDSLNFMHGLLKEQRVVIEHSFKSRPDFSQDSLPSPFESTTLDVWLVPRLVTAAAVLSARCSGVLSGPFDKCAQLRSSLISLADQLLQLALDSPPQACNVRLLLFECLKASFRSLTHIGCPSFLPSAPPPVSLLPREGEHPNLASFFSKDDAGQTYRAHQKAYGDGINRLWMEEDHSAFTPQLDAASPAVKAVFARALLLISCQLSCRLATTYRAELYDIGDTAALLLLSNWQCDMALDSRVMPNRSLSAFLSARRIELSASIVTTSSTPTLSTPIVERLSVMIARQVAAVLGEDGSIPAQVVDALLPAIALLRKGKAGAWEEAATHLRPHVASLITEISRSGGGETSGMQMDEEDKENRDQMLQFKALALEAFLLVMQHEGDPRLVLQASERLALQHVFTSSPQASISVNGGNHPTWMDDEQYRSLTTALERVQSGQEQSSSPSSLPSEYSHHLVEIERVLERGVPKADKALEDRNEAGLLLCSRAMCSSARTLYPTATGVRCSICDGSGRQTDEVVRRPASLSLTGMPEVWETVRTAKKALQLAHSTASIAVKEACIRVLYACLHHADPEEVVNSAQRQNMASLVRLGLTDKNRRLRLLMGKVVATYVAKESDALPTVHEPLRARISFVFAIYRDILQSNNARAKETALLGLARLGENTTHDVQENTLLALVLQLGSDPLLKSLAYTAINEMASRRRCTNFQLLSPALESISTQIVERIHSTPTLFLEVLQLTNQNQSTFLLATLSFTLPHLLELQSEKTLSLIARAIGQDIQTMCFNSTSAILKYFLMQPGLKRDRGIATFIQTVRGGGAHDINLRSLLKSYSVDLLGHLVARLGYPEHHQAALDGLHHMNSTLNDRHGANKSASSKGMSLSVFLKDEILAILSWLNDELMNGHGKKTMEHKYWVARSIGSLIDVVGQSISIVTPQLMATMNTTMQVNELMMPTLESWHTFITKLGYAVVGPFIGQTAAALVASWPRFGRGEKSVAQKILSYIVIESGPDLKPYLLQDFPNLDELRTEIPDICSRLANMGTTAAKRPEQRLQHILDRAANENSSVCGQALAELRNFLTGEREYVQRITSGNTFDPVVGHIVHILFATVGRDEEAEGLRDLCLDNLGILGAIDPDRFKHDGIDQKKELLQDFTDKDEIGDFAVHLIRDVLVSAFKATNDTKHQAALAYAIQELLKLAGFSSSLLPQADNLHGSHRGANVSLRVKQRWTKLPSRILDTIAPLLESKYSVHLGNVSSQVKPIYLHSSSFKEWVQHWTNDLILNTQGDHAKAIFTIFRSVIRDHDLSIAQYILPHLVLDILVLGSREQSEEIRDEIVAVLQDQVETTTGFEPERRLLSAQVIFALFDHLSVWMRIRSHQKQKQSKRVREDTEAAVGKVDMLLSSISQELMASASLKCRAYARSLLNFEQRIRALKGQGRGDRELQQHYENMHLIYAKLDEPDGMEGISTRVISPSLEHQIREHESTGRWTSAQSCWEVKIQEKQDDLHLHLGLLRCLRNLGHYDTMRTHVRGVLAIHPHWERSLDSFYVEGCCILSDWQEVKRRLAKEESGRQYSTEHATARVMLAMHEGDQVAFKTAIKDARSVLGKPLIAVGKNSYVSVYDSVLQLHMLYELGMISEAFGMTSSTSTSPPLSRAELAKALAGRLESTLPSFRTQEPLLSLRRSAFSTRNQTDFRDGIGQSWIASSKIARRSGHLQTAYSAALQASQCKAPFAFVQQAKLLALGDQGQAALQELRNALQIVREPEGELDNGAQKHSFANAHLFLARLADQAGRSKPNEIIERYRKCTDLDPHSEKMWYYLGHYYDQGTERDQPNGVKVVANVFTQHLNTCKNLVRSALFGTKFFYRSLPRALTIWLDCGADEGILAAIKSKSNKEPSADVQSKLASFRSMNDIIRRAIKRLTAYQWLAVFPQLVSRVVHKNEMVWKLLIEIICHVTEAYPHQAMWTMIAGSQSKDPERKRRFNDIITRLKGNTKAKPGVTTVITQTHRMATELLYLCDFPVGKDTKLSMAVSFPKLLALADGQLILPLQSSVSVNLPGNYKTESDHQAFEKDLPRIIGFDNNVDVMSSLQKPRKIVILASDGKQYPFLCKPNDDLRKDARLMEFDTMINNLLQSNPESRKRRLYIRTYSVITLNEVCGLIEWVPNTIGLRHILHKLYHARNIPLYSSQVQTEMDKARADPRNAGDIFEKQVLSRYPSVFHEWFVASFPEPSAWLKARLAYAHTLAVMSMVGYVLGLGDRHGENVLFDSESGDTVHVDLNCLFDKGATFDIPERVPFRLTHNLVDALGVTGYEGVFRRAAEISMAVLRDNKDSLMSVLEAMVHDPLVEWGIDNRGKSRAAGQPDPRMIEARRSLDPVMQKLNGKLKRGTTSTGLPAWTSAYSTNSLVDALIRDATSNTLLSQMYVGWASYL